MNDEHDNAADYRAMLNKWNKSIEWTEAKPYVRTDDGFIQPAPFEFTAPEPEPVTEGNIQASQRYMEAKLTCPSCEGLRSQGPEPWCRERDNHGMQPDRPMPVRRPEKPWLTDLLDWVDGLDVLAATNMLAWLARHRTTAFRDAQRAFESGSIEE